MAETITLEIPEDVIEKARAASQRSGHSLEAVLQEWLERAASQDVERFLEPGGEYMIYTPLESYAAADALEKMLKEHQTRKNNEVGDDE